MCSTTHRSRRKAAPPNEGADHAAQPKRWRENHHFTSPDLTLLQCNFNLIQEMLTLLNNFSYPGCEGDGSTTPRRRRKAAAPTKRNGNHPTDGEEDRRRRPAKEHLNELCTITFEGLKKGSVLERSSRRQRLRVKMCNLRERRGVEIHTCCQP